jgi:uncharacterized protein YndB with AHSA1/START domain
VIAAIGTIAGVVVLAIVVVAAIAATRPATIDVRRSIAIDAPPDRVYALISDLHRWPEWQADDERDPAAARTFGGPHSGVGATSQWDGKRGAGSMRVTQAEPDREVTVEVDFVKPFAAHNVNVLQLEPARNATNVTWSWHGQLPYVARVMGVFVDMNAALSKHFEDGLANLKALAER